MVYVKEGKKFNSGMSIVILEDEYTSTSETIMTTLYKSTKGGRYWLLKTDVNGDNCRVETLSNEEAFDVVINISTTYGTGKTAERMAQENERQMPGITAYVNSLDEV